MPNVRLSILPLCLVASVAFSADLSQARQGAASTQARGGEAEFRELYKELVEINTTLSVGSCTQAAQAMQARLARAGYPSDDLHLVVPPNRPRDGNLVAELKGTSSTLKPILLLAHIDVVEAKREDWQRDPFKLTEEGGYFYGRGVADDKAMAAVFTDSMVRFKREGFKPKRSIKLALTCGEETPNVFNGVSYLIANERPLIDAAFAINEGGGGELDGTTGKYLYNGVQAGEKLYQDFTLETTNKGTLLAPYSRQCDLWTRAGARQDPGVRISRRIQRHHSSLLSRVWRNRRRRPRRGSKSSSALTGSRRYRAIETGSDVERHAAHHVRRNDDQRRTRTECIASACRGERELPHLPRSRSRGNT